MIPHSNDGSDVILDTYKTQSYQQSPSLIFI